jgi:hypothetical protein
LAVTPGRLAISRRKPARRCCALLSSMLWSWARCSSQLLDHSSSIDLCAGSYAIDDHGLARMPAGIESGLHAAKSTLIKINVPVTVELWRKRNDGDRSSTSMISQGNSGI